MAKMIKIGHKYFKKIKYAKIKYENF